MRGSTAPDDARTLLVAGCVLALVGALGCVVVGVANRALVSGPGEPGPRVIAGAVLGAVLFAWLVTVVVVAVALQSLAWPTGLTTGHGYSACMSATKVAVIGAGGRMGATVCGAVEEADDLELVGRFDVGDDLGDLGGADVVVEFSVPDASPANVAHCVEQGVHVVVGTTGWSEERVASAARPGRRPPRRSGCSSPRTSPSARC